MTQVTFRPTASVALCAMADGLDAHAPAPPLSPAPSPPPSSPSPASAAKPASSSRESLLVSFLSGGFGGVMAVAVGYPLDLVKFAIQSSPTNSPTSIMPIMRGIVATKGIRGLYSGASTQVMGVMPVNSTYWWGYDVGLRIAKWFREFTGNPSAPSAGVHPVDAMWAGAFSALPGTVVTAPIERIKVLLQQQALFPHRVTHKFNGLFDCGAHLLRTGGMRSLFRGFNITLIRDIPGSVCYFTANEIVRKKVQSMQADPSKPSVLATLAGGACAGMANWIVSLPADVVKTRWQSAADGRYRGLLDVVRHILHESGPSAFFRGIKPVLIRAAPTTATSFLGVELSRRVLFATGLFD